MVVVDASKYFYQFQRGTLTTRTALPWLVYGTPYPGYFGNKPVYQWEERTFPAIVCRYALTFIRMLKEPFEAFRGDPKINCWWTGFSEEGYNPDLG